jgi:hypothetical protein
VTNAFTSKRQKKMFEANPEKYVPAYGGYCLQGTFQQNIDDYQFLV